MVKTRDGRGGRGLVGRGLVGRGLVGRIGLAFCFGENKTSSETTAAYLNMPCPRVVRHELARSFTFALAAWALYPHDDWHERFSYCRNPRTLTGRGWAGRGGLA